jgi:tRNA threonylcarbamoyladenosine biosynthesis protein TsaE
MLCMPILDEHTLDFVSHSPEQTHRFGMRLGALVQAGDVLCLEGELGTGKTCLTQGIGHGMGIRQPITSPTFTLIAEYRPLPPAPTLYHIDLYRLGAPVEEALALGMEEYLHSDGVCVIEWAERIMPIVPDERLWITLRHLEVFKRGIVMKAAGIRHQQLVRRFREAAFGR